MARFSRALTILATSASVVGLALIAPTSVSTSPAQTPTQKCDWKVVQTPDLGPEPSTLGAADALANDDIWAVGTHFINGQTDSEPLILHYDGHKWRVVPNPQGQLSAGFLRGVAAASSDDVWAVGQANEATTLTEHFNGKRWKIVPSPNPGGGHNGLSGIVAFGSDDIWAVGAAASTYGSITLHWDGAWHVVVNQHTPMFDGLAAVTARSNHDLWAVGYNQTPDQDHLTFGEHFNGSQWTLTDPVSPGRYDAIWALGGTATDSFSVPHVLVERHC